MNNIRALIAASAESGISWFFNNLSTAFIWAIPAIAACVGFFVYYWWSLLPRSHSLEWIAMSEKRAQKPRMTLTMPYHPLEKKDALPMLIITAVYASTAFFRLGDLSVPQSVVKFQQGDSYGFSYDEPVTVDKVSFYT